MYFSDDLDKQLKQQEKLYEHIDKFRTTKLNRRKEYSEVKRVKLGESGKKIAKSKKQKKVKLRRQRKVVRSYKTYINSDLWTKRKNRYFRQHGKRCEICGKTRFVTLHHKEYNNRYGDEPDTELIAFCFTCHQLFHENYKTTKNMQKETTEFVEGMRATLPTLKELDNSFNEMFK